MSISTHAIILVTTTPGRARHVANSIKDNEVVDKVFVISGQWDVVVAIEGDIDEISDFLVNDLQSTEGVSETLLLTDISSPLNGFSSEV